MNIIYLIQTSSDFPDLLKYLKDKDHVLLSYKENTKRYYYFFSKFYLDYREKQNKRLCIIIK